jgi:hypothetical protein
VNKLGLRLINIALAVFLVFVAVSAQARDCSISKEFEIKKPQSIAGSFEDPTGAVLSGIDVELLSGKKAIRKLRTDNLGKYDFGEVPTGRYRIRTGFDNHFFCAPKVVCGLEGCSLSTTLSPNPKGYVMVQ